MAMALEAKYYLSTPPTVYYPLLKPQSQTSNSLRRIRVGIRCSHHAIQAQHGTTTKKKGKPSFFEQIRHKWSHKVTSQREKFPWQEQEQQQQQQFDNNEQSFGVTLTGLETDAVSPVGQPISCALPNRLVSSPWLHETDSQETKFDSHPEITTKKEENVNGLLDYCDKVVVNSGVQNKEVIKLDNVDDYKKELNVANVKIGANSIKLCRDKQTEFVREVIPSLCSMNEMQLNGNLEAEVPNRLPWQRNTNRRKRSNMELVEKMIPEHELLRLRNVSLRMLERIKVGSAGITQALVDTIHRRWKLDEVVKLKFEEPHSLQMKRTHEILESRTGGLVIWRSGSSVVLFRGMAYQLLCVQSFTKHNQMQPEDVMKNVMHNVGEKHPITIMKKHIPVSVNNYNLQNLSKEELMDMCEMNYLLDDLGPRFKDWPGCEPLPVDADLLPPVVAGYKTPFRLLPCSVKPGLRDHEMTEFRRLARKMPPHFALGRNRELQGLANAMVKLWEKSAIAKIAIKRGVLNTRNERMTEELKKLTGGTLVSRNKDYIVFYRGNDFLPPIVLEALKERLKLTDVQQDEEEQARDIASALIESKTKDTEGPLVAGTLAETMAATSRWGKLPSCEEVEEMMRDSTSSRHASLLRYLEKKLVLAKRKLRMADRALAKVQENLDPAELPSDLETITNEERFLLRKMGLSMKPFLLLGQRGVYNGTIENMHLHWKYRELVKIILKGKSFAQAKQIAISLEAESGGVLVSLDKTPKGIAIIVYRGKNYMCPLKLKPQNLLTKRQALARSVELQRREALKHHIMDLEERIELVMSELEETR